PALGCLLLAAATGTGWAPRAGAGPSGAEGAAPVLKPSAITVAAGGRKYAVHQVRIRLKSARFKLGLAKGRVGPVEELAAIAARFRAVAAINGSFFDAYTPGPIQQPNHTLITDGRLVHRGTIGTLLGFTADRRALMDRVPLKIEGALDGRF